MLIQDRGFGFGRVWCGDGVGTGIGIGSLSVHALTLLLLNNLLSVNQMTGIQILTVLGC